jgi:hypothetical protein
MTLHDFSDDLVPIITVCIAVIGFIPVIINLIATNKNLRSKVFLDTITLLDGKNQEIRSLRHKLDDLIKTAERKGKKFDVLSLKQKEKDELDKLARAYDQIGLLVKHGIVPTDFLFDFYSKPIVKAWKNLKGLFSDRRLKQPGHMLKFEILATGAALYRRDKYQEQPEFSISDEDKAKWKKWNKWTTNFFKKKSYA